MKQGKPKPGKQTVLPHVMLDLLARAEQGMKTYGRALKTKDAEVTLWTYKGQAGNLVIVSVANETKQSDGGLVMQTSYAHMTQEQAIELAAALVKEAKK